MTATSRDLFFIRVNRTPLVKLLVGFGSLFGRLLPVRVATRVFFFFPFYHVGGAEKVHAAIVRCLADERPWVFFTKKSANKGFWSLFEGEARLLDLWPLLKYCYPVSVGVVASLVNRSGSGAVVFGSNSLFYYLLVPYLDPTVRRIDLLHAFGGGAEDFSLPVAGALDARVAINARTVSDLKEQYRVHGLPEELGERIVLIENSVDIPRNHSHKGTGKALKVLYVGRGSEEKRVHLVGRVAASCSERKIPVEVSVVGDAMAAVDPSDRQFCRFLGEVSDHERLARLYYEADLLLITSSREGFPMVIMEGMAHGVVPISTDVGGIPVHVEDGRTGRLVSNGLSEEQIVEAICRILSDLDSRRDLLQEMSRAAYDYARAHFGGEKFCSSYRSLLGPGRGERGDT